MSLTTRELRLIERQHREAAAQLEKLRTGVVKEALKAAATVSIGSALGEQMKTLDTMATTSIAFTLAEQMKTLNTTTAGSLATPALSKIVADMSAQNREVSRGLVGALRNVTDVQASFARTNVSKMLGELVTHNAEITRGFAGALRNFTDFQANLATPKLSKMLADLAAQNRTLTRDFVAALRAINLETTITSDAPVNGTAVVHEEARRLASDVRDWYATLKPQQKRTMRGHVIGLILGACTLAMICSEGNTAAICLGIASYAYQLLLAWDAIQDILEDN